MNPTLNKDQLFQHIQEEAKHCVKCGLCLPYCPTYALTENECESPRGRIAMMDGLAKKQIPITKKLETYLNHCLNCQACEAVCPAQVQYHQLIDDTRTYLNLTSSEPYKIPFLLDYLIHHPRWVKIFAILIRFYQQSGLQVLARRSGILKLLGLNQLESFLPSRSEKIFWLKKYYPAKNQFQGNVALFTGCLGNLMDQNTLAASIKLLTACGFGVYVPSPQYCCGALHQHVGYPHTAETLTKKNQEIFRDPTLKAIITTASACTAKLMNKEFTCTVSDIMQFLATVPWPTNLELKPLDKQVVLHNPCSLANVVRATESPYMLLQKIPQLTITRLKQEHCCGAAGLHMVRYPEIAESLAKQLLNKINPMTDYFVTSNIGCQLHLAKTLRKQCPKIQVLHPIELLANRLIIASRG